MYRVTVTRTPASPAVEFYEPSSEFRDNFESKYRMFIYYVNKSVLPGGATVSEFLWETAEKYQEFLSDPITVEDYEKRAAYNAEHNITVDVVKENFDA